MAPKRTAKTLDELIEHILLVAPDAEPYVDDETGLVSIDTGLIENADGELERSLLDDDEQDDEYEDDELFDSDEGDDEDEGEDE